MTAYISHRLRCPRCHREFGITAVGSCNTFGAIGYTDGFVTGPMFDENSRLIYCLRCGELCWRDEYETVGTENGPSFDFGLHEEYGYADFEDFPDLLEGKPWRNSNEEKYIRIRAWWAANNRRTCRLRSHAKNADHSPNPELTADETENLRQLLNILRENDQDDSMIRAEIYRELGRFDDCLEALEKVEHEYFELSKTAIAKLARDRDSSVGVAWSDKK